MSPDYPKQWEFLKGKFESAGAVGGLSHAYIFSGQDMAKLALFGENFIKLINCLGDKKPCQRCRNCLLLDKKSHPDLFVVKSGNSESSQKNEKDMLEIDIKQIRKAQDFLTYKSYYGGYKAVLIENAERINIEAQNCFLKSLEEPSDKTLIILLCQNPEMLLLTISSRCQVLKFISHDSGNFQLSEDMLRIINADLAERFKYVKSANLDGDNFGLILKNLQGYFRNLLLVKIGAVSGKESNYSVEKLKKIIALIDNLIRQSAISNINSKMALEILLLEI